MRGHVDPQSRLFSYSSPEERVPAEHPLRSIKTYTESAFKQIRPLLDGLYSEIGRPSIPPERRLKGQLLIALYSVRSDRLFCEMLDYIILFRWFLDMNLQEASFDASTFSKNRERLASEQFFGWGKTVGGLRKTRLRGVRRNTQLLYLTGAACNLLRISRLSPATG
jgi:hypothetical protein